MSTLEEQWKDEHLSIQRHRNTLFAQENDLKASIKALDFKLRLVKRDYNKIYAERRSYDKILRNFFKRKKAEQYRHRRWSADNPGKAFDIVMGVK